ncbi:hypothetical protein RRG08_021437 [Elysia crispata]|uniref:Uncharacterized protein n=1 Tax=Elysia crispata TaxID=231223 RepID=A0AAE1A6Z2_9GAST|nr:hypothetical protein RRG08_021437 [Elysia crispata]
MCGLSIDPCSPSPSHRTSPSQPPFFSSLHHRLLRPSCRDQRQFYTHHRLLRPSRRDQRQFYTHHRFFPGLSTSTNFRCPSVLSTRVLERNWAGEWGISTHSLLIFLARVPNRCLLPMFYESQWCFAQLPHSLLDQSHTSCRPFLS